MLSLSIHALALYLKAPIHMQQHLALADFALSVCVGFYPRTPAASQYLLPQKQSSSAFESWLSDFYRRLLDSGTGSL